MEESIRKCSVLIPYKVKDGGTLVFLQKRSQTQKAPGMFGFFGGGVEGKENPEQALLREIKEGMDFQPAGYHYFGFYEFERRTFDVFYQEAGEDFEKGIKILEGDYGRWFSEPEALNHEKVTDITKEVLKDFFPKIKSFSKKA